MTDNKKIIEIFKSRNNLLDILKLRGYNTESYDGFSIGEITTLYNNSQLDMLIEGDKKIYIKYFIEKTLRPTNIYEIIDDLYNVENILEEKDTLLFVVKDEPSENLQKLQSTILEQDKTFIIVINIDRLQFNILKHSMVPFHRILSEVEKQKIIEKYNIIDNNIPEISRFDPVAQVIGIRPGEYCEIQRPSKTSIMSYFYRICSN